MIDTLNIQINSTYTLGCTEAINYIAYLYLSPTKIIQRVVRNIPFSHTTIGNKVLK